MDSQKAVKTLDLFGGTRKWDENEWRATDDRVRGGSSISHLTASSSANEAKFYGLLDIDTLGGAGFASQRTTSPCTDHQDGGNGDCDRTWDLSSWDGILLTGLRGDDKRYTLTVKDSILPRNPHNGREQSTVSWEYDFYLTQASQGKLRIPWASFSPTYRGRERKDAKPLNIQSVRRFSLMMRSFFASQKGPFELHIASISVYRDGSDRGGKMVAVPSPYRDNDNEHFDEKTNDLEHGEDETNKGWARRVFDAVLGGLCIRSNM